MDVGVAGGQRLDVGEGHHVGVEVRGLAGGALRAHELADEPLLAFHGLVAVRVERALGHVPVVAHVVVRVALALDSAEALFQVGGPPWAVEVVDRGEAFLHVGAGAELLGASHQHADLAGSDFGEQLLASGGVVAGVVHERYLLGGHAQLDEAVLEVLVGVPSARRGRARVAEDELRAQAWRLLLPDPGDVLGACLDLAVLQGAVVLVAFEELGVEGDLSPVASDPQEVVDLRRHVAVAHEVGPVGQFLHLLLLAVGDGHGDGHLLQFGQRQLDVVVGDHVGELLHRVHQFGQVLEAREPLLDLESVAFGLQFHGGYYLAVGASPCGERVEALGLEGSGREVALHVVQLAHGVGDRRAGHERDVASVPGLAQPFAFVEQVLAFRGGRQLHAQVGGCDGHAEVLEVVGLVDDEHVHAKRFELDARQCLVVARLLAVSQALHGGLGAFARRLQPFDGGVLVAPGLGGGLDGLGELVDAGAHVPQPSFLADVQLAEPALRHDHRIPVAGGDPAPEASHRFGVALRVLVHDEDPSGRIEPEHVAGPLVHEVVGDHEHRLGRLAETFRLVGEGDALERLAGSDDVRDEGPLVAAQGAGHRVLLMRTQGDAVGDAGRGQVGSVDVAGPHAVESAVVQGGEPLRAVGVLEHPLVPRVADRVGLLDGGHRGLLVLDPFGLAGRRGLRGGVLGDGDLRIVQARLQQLERVAVLGAVRPCCLVVDVAAARVADAPLSELGDPVDRVLGELAGREPVAAHVERLHHEVVDVPGGDPRGPQRRLDLLGLQRGGLYAFQQIGHVFEPFRVRLVGARGLGVLRLLPPLSELFLAACAERLVVVGARVDGTWRRAVGVVCRSLAQVGQVAGDAPDPFADRHVGGEPFGEPRGVVGAGHETACHRADGRVRPYRAAMLVVGRIALEQVGEDRGLVGGFEPVGVGDLVDEQGEVPDGHAPVGEDRRVVLWRVAVAPCPAQCVPQWAGAVRSVPCRRVPRLPLSGVGSFEGDA